MKKFTMYQYRQKFEFKRPPRNISYPDGNPLILSNEFSFFHNKNKFRKELNRLQFLFKDYTDNPLTAAGIRDSYLKEEFSEEFFIILFTTNEIVRKTNQIVEKFIKTEYVPGCFYLESTSDYILLITKDMDGLIYGIDILEEIFTQTFEDYLKQGAFEDYVKVRPFLIHNCGIVD
ncbi:MAG: hypothetical protein ACFFFB_01175 [Candidatus Heimdallarchaeota archaeon]